MVNDRPAVPSRDLGRDFVWDMAVFKVEDRIFRVNRHALVQHSEVFEGMYLLPSTGEGTTGDNPIVLEGHKAADFEALLMVLHPTMEDTISGKFSLTKEQWIGVLRISRPWEMTRVRELAIKTLSSQAVTLTPVEKVKLARDHKVASWLVEGLTSLTVGDPGLSSDALEDAVGLRTAFRIVNIQVGEPSKPMVGPVTRNGTMYMGLALASVHCSSCHNPCMPSGSSCHSCSKVLEPEGASTMFVSNETWSSVVGCRSSGLYIYLPGGNPCCQACGNRVFNRSVNCKSCSTSIYNNSYNSSTQIYATTGPSSRSSDLATAETMVREVFKEEIGEYEV